MCWPGLLFFGVDPEHAVFETDLRIRDLFPLDDDYLVFACDVCFRSGEQLVFIQPFLILKILLCDEIDRGVAGDFNCVKSGLSFGVDDPLTRCAADPAVLLVYLLYS